MGELTRGSETWRALPGYEGLYQVSNCGAVWSARKQVRLKQRLDARDGKYYQVTLTRGGHRKARGVHQVVLEAFVGPRPGGMFACHNNGISTDNRVENLRWDTPQANSLDAVKHGTNRKTMRTHCPLGHPLAEPNLVGWHASRRRRGCLACSRARAYERVARLRGEPYDFETGAHSYYRQITAA